MPPFASAAWVSLLDVAAGRLDGPFPAGGPVEIQYLFEADGGTEAGDGPAGETGEPRCGFWLRLDSGGCRAGVGTLNAPTVTYRQSFAVAKAISGGERSAHHALETGELEVRGDATRLIPWRPLLGQLDEAFAAVRAAAS